MKKLILTTGPMGSGKSTFLESLGMGLHALSADALRMVLSAPEMDAFGGWGLSQDVNAKAWKMVRQLCEERMREGQTVAVDGVFRLPGELDEYLALAQKAGYETLVADFSGTPAEVCKARNAQRPAHKRVPDPVIESACAAMGQAGRKAAVEKLCRERGARLLDAAQGGPGARSQALDFLKVPALDFSGYEEVWVIGDLQGCSDVAFGPGGLLSGGPKPGAAYVFVGDLVDRGIQNGLAVQSVLDFFEAAGGSAYLVWGNHEDHLEMWSRGLPSKSAEFNERTEPQLKAAGVDRKRVADLLAGSRDLLLAKLSDGSRLAVSHAGLPGLPPEGDDGEPQWHLLSRKQLIKGAGEYSAPVDKRFDEQMRSRPAAQRWIQAHGHRNKLGEGHGAWAHSFNLEDRVEFGGYLRASVFKEGGWRHLKRKNEIYMSWRERYGKGAAMAGEEMDDAQENAAGAKGPRAESGDGDMPVPEWILRPDDGEGKLSRSDLDALGSHEGVAVKPLADFPHLCAFNFTRDVFFEKSWDQVTVKARGLFADPATGSIAARGYDKFFNIGETEQTEPQALEKSLAFPVTAYVKENGYLGNLGFDEKTGSLVFASKSTTAGAFAAKFKEILEAELGAGGLEKVALYLKQAEASMVFEVIDPEFDPHMIEYAKPKAVLLDVFRRSATPEKLGYESLKKLASKLGLEAKRRAFEFKDWQSMAGWMARSSSDLSYEYSGEPIEGVVIEDRKGFMTKVKLPFYSFWKSMRSSKDRIQKAKEALEQAGQEWEQLRQKDLSLAQQATGAGGAMPGKLAERIEFWELERRLARFGQWKLEDGFGVLAGFWGRETKKPLPGGILDSKAAQKAQKALSSIDRCLESDSHGLAAKFLGWCAGQSASALQKDIIALRNEALAAGVWGKGDLSEKWTRFDPSEKEKPAGPSRGPKM